MYRMNDFVMKNTDMCNGSREGEFVCFSEVEKLKLNPHLP